MPMTGLARAAAAAAWLCTSAFGAPFAYASYTACWRKVWTGYGPRWVNVCNLDYPY